MSMRFDQPELGLFDDVIVGTPPEQSISPEKKFVLDMQQALRMTETSLIKIV